MIHSRLAEAISNLAPGIEFTLNADDLDQITVMVGTLPSEAAIQTEIDRLDAQAPILEQIETLEQSVTPRRLREAYADSTFIDDVEAQIATLRSEL